MMNKIIPAHDGPDGVTGVGVGAAASVLDTAQSKPATSIFID